MDVTSESESLELELALELELDELDDDEYRRDFDLRFFEPFECFRADFFEDSSSLRFFPALTAEQFSGKFLLGGCITGLFSRELARGAICLGVSDSPFSTFSSPEAITTP